MRLGTFSVACVLVGCGGASSLPEAKAPSSEPGAPAEAPVKDDAASSPVSAAAPELPGAPPATDPGWDFHVWADAHQLKVDLVSDGCEAAKLGEKPDDTVWCAHHVDSKEGAVLYTRALYVARAGRLVKLVEVPVAAGVVDDPSAPKAEKDRQVVRLELVPGDAKKLELRLTPGFDCEKALAANDENKAAARDLTRALDERIRKVCASRGSWAWTGGTLRKSGK